MNSTQEDMVIDLFELSIQKAYNKRMNEKMHLKKRLYSFIFVTG